MSHRNAFWPLIYGFLLLAFTVYVLLDTFVITRVYASVQSEQKYSNSADHDTESYGDGDETGIQDNEASQSQTDDVSSGEEDTVTVISESVYTDEHIAITVTEHREYDTNIYIADIQLVSPEYLKTAFAQDVYGKNVTEKTSETASRNNAILAINGDFYGSQEKGYVLRNGVLYRESASKRQQDLVIYTDGSFEIITEEEVSAEQLLEHGAQQILSFGPALVMDGTVAVSTEEEVGKAKASNPRTAIGIIDDLHYVFIVSDGRTEESEGLSLYQLATFMQSIGVSTGYNLDGGGSSTMYFNGEVINNPTTNGKRVKERSVSDIVYIGY